MDTEIEDKLIEAKIMGYPVLECSECGEVAFIVEAEGMGLGTIPDKHYPVGECVNCGGQTPKED